MLPERIATELPRCVLRRFDQSDRNALIREANNPNVSRTLLDRFPYPYTVRAAEEWLALATSRTPDVHLAIEWDGALAGGISAMRGAANARLTAEIGYWLGESHWGRGIATAAVRAFADALFAHLDLERLEAGTFAANRASQRVLEKAGFDREGVERRKFLKNGEFIDDVRFARLRGAASWSG